MAGGGGAANLGSKKTRLKFYPEVLGAAQNRVLRQLGPIMTDRHFYTLAQRYSSLSEMLRLYQQKYSIQDIGHLLYSLVYFDDADRERMPIMLWDTDWRSIKKALLSWVQQIAG